LKRASSCTQRGSSLVGSTIPTESLAAEGASVALAPQAASAMDAITKMLKRAKIFLFILLSYKFFVDWLNEQRKTSLFFPSTSSLLLSVNIVALSIFKVKPSSFEHINQ
jgi:hypothetical protein